ncbi:hypothetical protein EU348_00350 [Chryseobacterium indologenes]|uniref:Uncharacterized protein n=1 Tax=Chryseobacterium indologenes TaxID=253 RepID=A0A411DH71_CHRID|nr:hypothetical protein EU348_00350 [Chryseobacterium indologenes]
MKHILTAGLLYLSVLSFGQVGIGTAQPNHNAILDLTATNKGFLPPRMTTLQRDAIPGVSQGLMIFNTDLKCLQYWDTSNWVGQCKTTAPGIITALDCSTAVFTGTLEENLPASGVSATIAYSGGNGGTHSGQTVASTGVTGLTATLAPGAFANGNGMLTYMITGTPVGSGGTASFAISLGGQACTLTINVDSIPPIVTDLSDSCTGWRLPYQANGTSASGDVNGQSLDVNFSSYAYSGSYPNNYTNCSITTIAGNSFFLNGTYPKINLKFSKDISNFKVTMTGLDGSENVQFSFKKNGIVVSPILKIGNGCPGSSSISSSTYKITSIIPEKSKNGGLVINFGGEWFDEVIITGNAHYAGYILNFCVGSVKN